MPSYDRSIALYEETRQHLAGGVSSNVRYAATPVPLFFVRGEGAGVVVLKPASQVSDEDRVYAWIRGVAVKVADTVPSHVHCDGLRLKHHAKSWWGI